MTPEKSKCRPSTLSQENFFEILHFIMSSSINRSMTNLEVAAGPLRNHGVSRGVIQKELQVKGHGHHAGYEKPPSPAKP